MSGADALFVARYFDCWIFWVAALAVPRHETGRVTAGGTDSPVAKLLTTAPLKAIRDVILSFGPLALTPYRVSTQNQKLGNFRIYQVWQLAGNEWKPVHFHRNFRPGTAANLCCIKHLSRCAFNSAFFNSACGKNV